MRGTCPKTLDEARQLVREKRYLPWPDPLELKREERSKCDDRADEGARLRQPLIVKDWSKNENRHAACCFENYIYNGNKHANVFTTHNCRSAGVTDGKHGKNAEGSCGGHCDPDGCDFNAYRNGRHDFWGPWKTVDTRKNVTVVTQFLTESPPGDTESSSPRVGDSFSLAEVRRFYLQDGKLIGNAATKLGGGVLGEKWDSITDGYCAARAQAFSAGVEKPDCQADMGGLAKMGESFQRGHVLALTFC
eukprot:g14069.t1